jgi:hypothetical protein
MHVVQYERSYQIYTSFIVADTVHLSFLSQQNPNCHILLQNENGPCPLLAAANGLLLRGTLEFPAHCLTHGVASLEDVTNMLGNQALASDDSESKFHIDELLDWIPKFQHGMDVNLGFCEVDQYEYTAQLTAWDMFRIRLVHGWLVDPEAAEAEVIQKRTYNVLVEKIINAREAAAELGELEKEPLDEKTACDDASVIKREEKIQHIQDLATQGTLIEHFLESTSHQLTAYGLKKLSEYLSNDQLAVFFRNNHFALITKHDDQLYLLVTDLGYADSADIVWERLDAIDGNTTLVNADFCVSNTRKEDEAYQLALQMSLQEQTQITSSPPVTGTIVDLPPVSDLNKSFVSGGTPAVGSTAADQQGFEKQIQASVQGQSPVQSTKISAQLSAARVASVSTATQQTALDQDVLLAMQLQSDWNSSSQRDDQISLELARQLESEDSASLELARKLQAEENARDGRRGARAQDTASAPSSSQSGCIIS